MGTGPAPALSTAPTALRPPAGPQRLGGLSGSHSRDLGHGQEWSQGCGSTGDGTGGCTRSASDRPSAADAGNVPEGLWCSFLPAEVRGAGAEPRFLSQPASRPARKSRASCALPSGAAGWALCTRRRGRVKCSDRPKRGSFALRRRLCLVLAHVRVSGQRGVAGGAGLGGGWGSCACSCRRCGQAGPAPEAPGGAAASGAVTLDIN